MRLGLLRVDDGVAARVLASFDVTADGVRAASKRIVSAELDGRERLLELAAREATASGSDVIATGHILLGLLNDTVGAAAAILLALDADAAHIRLQIARVVSSAEGHPVPSPGELAGALTVEQLIAALREAKEVAITNEDFEAATEVRDAEHELLALVSALPSSSDSASSGESTPIGLSKVRRRHVRQCAPGLGPFIDDAASDSRRDPEWA